MLPHNVDIAAIADALYRSAPIPMYVYDEHTLEFLSANDAAIAHFGYSYEELLAKTLPDVYPAEDRDCVLKATSSVDRSMPVPSHGPAVRHRRKDGALVAVEVANSHRIEYEGRSAIIATVFNVSGRQTEMDRIRTEQAVLEEAQEAAGLTNCIMDLRRKVCRFYGRRDDVNGATLALDEMWRRAFAVVHPDDREEMQRAADAVAAAVPYEGELRVIVDGAVRWLRGRTRVLRDDDGEPAAIVAIASDVTDLKEEDERLRRVAFTDAATGLPNRTALFEGDLVRGPLTGALLLVGFDGGRTSWKRTPACTHGHAAVVAEILQSMIPHEALLARYSDSVYAIVVRNRGQARFAVRLAKRIVERFNAPLTIGDEEVVFVPTVGVAGATEPVAFGDVAARAGFALAVAIDAKSHVVVHSAELQAAQERRDTIDRNLRHAIARRRIGVVYQPVVSVATGRIIGAEALMRWNCPGLGQVPPSEFVAIAEETDVILRLGAWILREACAEARRWALAGFGALRIAVNVSAKQVAQRDFVRLVRTTCEQTRIDPPQLELEITERLMMDNDLGIRNLEALRRLGVRVSIDDFGTGYSSLSYLASIPLDVVKIDRSFVAAIADEPFQARVARNVIELAHERGLSVVGEGVEHEAQFARLRDMGCDDVQGFLFGRPVKAEEFAAALRRQQLEARYS